MHRTSLFLFILMAGFSAGSAAGTMTRVVRFDPSDVQFNIEGFWTVVEMEGLQLSGEPGSPLLPSSPEVFILPGGAHDVTFSSRILSTVEIAGSGIEIMPAAVLRPFSDSEGPSIRVPDASIYSSGRTWPESPIIRSHSGSLSGRTVSSCLVQPWLYDPADGSLELVEEMEITVSWEEGPSSCLTSFQDAVAQRRTEVLQGSEIAGELDIPSFQQGGGDSQYLIICDSSFEETMEPLADFYVGRGLTVEIATVQDILNSFQGSDDAEKLRNFIRNRYYQHGTVFVLLAGDETLVPVRMVFLYCEGYSDTAPVDLYFADLDGTWDGNGDGLYGQPDDDLDLYADVILGRGLFSTVSQAQLFVQKTLTYQSSPPPGDWQTSAVLCGAVLFEDIGYTSDKGCDSMAVEFPPAWEVHKFYEELPGGGFTEHLQLIGSGSGWNHYAGHGNDRGIYWHMAPLGMMTNWIALDSLQNGSRTGIHTSIACHPGDYAGHDCCGEALLQNPDGGAVAVMFNTSFGWEGHWPSLGASEWMCIDLVRQVFEEHESCLGLAFSNAKDLRIPHMNAGYDRTFQSVLSFSAFMDPALRVLRSEHLEPDLPSDFSLDPPCPNPSQGGSAISFDVQFHQGSTLVSVHDLAGRLVWEEEVTSSGTVVWDCTDSRGRRVPVGVYILSARRGDLILSRLATVL